MKPAPALHIPFNLLSAFAPARSEEVGHQYPSRQQPHLHSRRNL